MSSGSSLAVTKLPSMTTALTTPARRASSRKARNFSTRRTAPGRSPETAEHRVHFVNCAVVDAFGQHTVFQGRDHQRSSRPVHRDAASSRQSTQRYCSSPFFFSRSTSCLTVASSRLSATRVALPSCTISRLSTPMVAIRCPSSPTMTQSRVFRPACVAQHRVAVGVLRVHALQGQPAADVVPAVGRLHDQHFLARLGRVLHDREVDAGPLDRRRTRAASTSSRRGVFQASAMRSTAACMRRLQLAQGVEDRRGPPHEDAGVPEVFARGDVLLGQFLRAASP